MESYENTYTNTNLSNGNNSNQNNNKIQNEPENTNTNISINIEKINEIFKSLFDSNSLYKKALGKEGEIRENYTPCKILDLKWVNNLINTFLYKENNDKFTIKDKIIQKDFFIFKNFSDLYPKNIEKGEFFIITEIFFVSLYQYIKDLENYKNNFPNYEIFLKNDRGAIIINDDIFIFETKNNDVNQRFNFIKIQSKNKNILKNKMLSNMDYELTQNNWEELKMNTNNQNLKQNINQKNFNNINNKNNNNKNIHNKGKENNNNIINNNSGMKKRNTNIITNNINNNNNIIININDRNNNNMNNNNMNNNNMNNINMNNINMNNINMNNINDMNNNNMNNKNNNNMNNINDMNNNNMNNMNNNININNNNININNNINNNNNNNINTTKEEDLMNRLSNLFNKENLLNERNKNLSMLEQSLIPLKKVKLNRLLPTLGLENIGATCYMNATLQCMAHFIEVSEEILTWYKYNNDKNKKKRELSYTYANVLDNIFFSKNKKYFSPKEFKQIISAKNVLFQGIQANDSKDVYNFVIEEMHNELNDLEEVNIPNFNENEIIDQRNEVAIFNYFKNKNAKSYHSILSRYLYGIYETITQCCNCQTMIYNFQAYNFLIFPLLEVKKYVSMCNNGNQFFNYQNYIINLNDCFNYYQKIDYFNGPNQIYCNSCNQLQDANYCNILYTTPTILSIVLNRGKNNVDFNEKFIFSTELSLGNFVKENQNMANYYLIGVICHVGDSSLSGHFFSYCRSDKNSPWYKYNDAIVSQSNENEFLNAKTPYILFYHKYT